MSTNPKIDFAVGGQAVIEGVMMRSPNFYTVSVRDSKGKIKTRQKKFVSLMKRMRVKGVSVLNIPLLRGLIHLVESMIIGIRSLNYSNAIFLDEDVAEDDETDSGGKETSIWKKFLFGFLGIVYVLGTLTFTIFLLKFLPLWIAEKAAEIWPYVEQHYLLFNAIDGVTKITIFLTYIIVISAMKDIRRVFQYHGAEHKSIFAYEAGEELTVENARKQSRFHPRCGTSFIFIVILMSVLVYTAIPPADTFWAKLGDRLIVIPIIAGISYELLKLSAKWQKNMLMRVFMAPGLWLQKLTTREPDDDQLEIALHSLKESLKVEEEFSQEST